jgi:hypothetical protein
MPFAGSLKREASPLGSGRPGAVRCDSPLFSVCSIRTRLHRREGETEGETIEENPHSENTMRIDLAILKSFRPRRAQSIARGN